MLRDTKGGKPICYGSFIYLDIWFGLSILYLFYMDSAIFEILNNLIIVFSNFYTPVFKTGRIMVYQCSTVRPSVRPSVRPFHMSRSKLRTPWPIHFKFHRVIGTDGLTVCILYGEIWNFHSRVM